MLEKFEANRFPCLQSRRRARIGIIGGSGPEAAIDLWQKILIENRRRMATTYTGDWHAPEVTTVSVPELGYSMELEERHQQVWFTLRAAAERLAPQVDVYAIACNTLNVFAPQLRGLGLSATLITPADAVLEELNREPIESVALLGSRQTMELGVWSSYGELNERYSVEVPTNGDAVHDLIYAIKQAGGNTVEVSKDFTRILDDLHSDVAVLACTELPLIAIPEEQRVPRLVDATDMLARSLLNWQPQDQTMSDLPSRDTWQGNADPVPNAPARRPLG